MELNGLNGHSEKPAKSKGIITASVGANVAVYGSARVTIMLVTPDLARAWLADRNSSNRTLRERDAKQFARQILTGRYRITNQGIGFDRAGIITDGQHRLQGIVIANVGVPIIVAEGLDPLARTVTDTGSNRTAADGAKLVLGGDNWRMKSKIMNAIFRCAYSGRTGKLTADDLVEAVDGQFGAGVQWMVRCQPRGRFSLAPILGAFVFAHKTDPNGVIEAWDEFANGTVTSASGAPMGKLRDYILQLDRTGGDDARKDVFHKTLATIDARLRGETLSKLQLSVTRSERFKRAYADLG